MGSRPFLLWYLDERNWNCFFVPLAPRGILFKRQVLKIPLLSSLKQEKGGCETDGGRGTWRSGDCLGIWKLSPLDLPVLGVSLRAHPTGAQVPRLHGPLSGPLQWPLQVPARTQPPPPPQVTFRNDSRALFLKRDSSLLRTERPHPRPAFEDFSHQSQTMFRGSVFHSTFPSTSPSPSQHCSLNKSPGLACLSPLISACASSRWLTCPLFPEIMSDPLGSFAPLSYAHHTLGVLHLPRLSRFELLSRWQLPFDL